MALRWERGSWGVAVNADEVPLTRLLTARRMCDDLVPNWYQSMAWGLRTPALIYSKPGRSTVTIGPVTVSEVGERGTVV